MAFKKFTSCTKPATPSDSQFYEISFSLYVLSDHQSPYQYCFLRKRLYYVVYSFFPMSL